MIEDLKKMGRKRLGGILMSDGRVTPEQVTEALEIQKDTGKMLGQVLVELGYITEFDLAKSLATQFQFPYINPSSYAMDRDVLELIPVETLYKYVFVPLDRFGNLLIVAMAGLLPEEMMQEIKKQTGCDLRIYIATARDVRAVLEKELPIDGKLRKKIEGPSIAPVVAKIKKRAAGKKKAAAAPAVKEAAPAPEAEPVAQSSVLEILDQAEAQVAAERETAASAEPEDISAEVGVVEAPEGDVDWQGLFDEVDKSIRDEIKKKKEVGEKGEDVDFDFD